MATEELLEENAKNSGEDDDIKSLSIQKFIPDGHDGYCQSSMPHPSYTSAGNVLIRLAERGRVDRCFRSCGYQEKQDDKSLCT